MAGICGPIRPVLAGWNGLNGGYWRPYRRAIAFEDQIRTLPSNAFPILAIIWPECHSPSYLDLKPSKTCTGFRRTGVRRSVARLRNISDTPRESQPQPDQATAGIAPAAIHSGWTSFGYFTTFPTPLSKSWRSLPNPRLNHGSHSSEIRNEGS